MVPATERLGPAMAAIHAVLLAGRPAALRERAAARDDDADEPDAAPIVTLRADPTDLAAIAARGPLTPVYAEFLRTYSSHDLVDAGLRCAQRAAWLTPVTNVVELTRVYADKPGFAPHWLVCAVDLDGCYVVDLDDARDGDCPVLYLRHVDDDFARPERVAAGFVAFLEQIARDSRAPARADRRTPPAAKAPAPARAPMPASDSDRNLTLPLLVAVLAAALLWWLR